MKLMRLPRLSLALWLIGVPLGAVGGPRGATAAPASPAAAAAPSTPTAPQPALPGEPGLPQQSPAEPPGQPLPAQQAAAVEGNPDWADTLERIAGSVVSIDVDSTRAFDTEWNSSAQATGFVVDAERGLILTNRHVVTPGPVTAEATFLNREEVQLYPVYRDPVHDFGIYRYNPQKLRFIKPKALQLYPEGAQIGREIRVVGNNAGEQLSILAGTLARIDRDGPADGVAKYTGFTTFSLQASSGTSGGSSGSPVIDIRGRVVGLNAGGANGAASSFYLPLGRVRRALELIQQGKPVPRGTLYTVFNYMPYDELERLGLDASTEAAVRKSFPRYTGMLVVTEVLPGSPSASVLQPGDILMRLNGRYVTQFEPLEDLIDGSVGKEVELELERGGKVLSAKLPVGDLHAITPSAYAEFGDAVVNTMSYQQARHFNVPTRGVYIANPGYVFGAAGIPRGALILELEGKKTDTLKDFEAGIAQLANGEHATVRYITIDDPNNTDLRALRMDRLWFPARHCDRNDAKGLWDCQQLPAGSPPKPEPVSSTAFPHFKDPRLNALAPSLALVAFDMPYSVSGITERNYHGTGLVVDAQRGLVVVDRNTVPVAIGDVTITFGGTVQVPGRVVYIHPQHNLAVVAYDPALIGATPVKSAHLAPRELTAGEPVWVVGLGADSQMHARKTEIAGIDPLELPLSRTMRFRDSNLETVQLVNPPLAIDGHVVTRFREVEKAAADKDSVQVTVWRGQGEQTLEVPTAELPGTDIDRLVEWAGATLQAPHRAMSVQRGIAPVGVYVAYFSYGSPATRYGLYPGRRIMEVDGEPTPDLDSFLKAVTGRPDRSSVRLKTITWNNAPEVITLKLDQHYWPAYELTRTPGGWVRRSLE